MRKQIVFSLLMPWLVEDLDVVVLEDLCCHCQKMLILVPPSFFVNSSNHSGKSCNRFLHARVVSCSSGVNSLMLSADSSAEHVKWKRRWARNYRICKVQSCHSEKWCLSFFPLVGNTEFHRRIFPEIAPLVCLRGAGLQRTCPNL